MRELWEDFKKFLMRGNVLDLAVAVVIGVAFKAVVDSLVADLIMPIVTMVVGKQGFEELTFTINDSVFHYGTFLYTVLSFVIIAATIFVIVKAYEKMQSRRTREGEEPESVPLTAEGEVLVQIRDLLRAQGNGSPAT